MFDAKYANCNKMNLLISNIDSKIENIDFEKIKFKLLNGDDKNNWTESKCSIAEMEYRRFLSLILIYPNEKIIPNKLMDAFWHQHILDTRKYFDDCFWIFGRFLHHNPYYGLKSIEEFEEFTENFEKTKKLYRYSFGEDMKVQNFGLCESDGSNCVSSNCSPN